MLVPLNSSDQTGTQVEAEARLTETASGARSANHLTDFFIGVFQGAFRGFAHAKSNALRRQPPTSARARLSQPRHLRQATAGPHARLRLQTHASRHPGVMLQPPLVRLRSALLIPTPPAWQRSCPARFLPSGC